MDYPGGFKQGERIEATKMEKFMGRVSVLSGRIYYNLTAGSFLQVLSFSVSKILPSRCHRPKVFPPGIPFQHHSRGRLLNHFQNQSYLCGHLSVARSLVPSSDLGFPYVAGSKTGIYRIQVKSPGIKLCKQAADSLLQARSLLRTQGQKIFEHRSEVRGSFINKLVRFKYQRIL